MQLDLEAESAELHDAMQASLSEAQQRAQAQVCDWDSLLTRAAGGPDLSCKFWVHSV